jgi:hypothetical protein
LPGLAVGHRVVGDEPVYSGDGELIGHLANELLMTSGMRNEQPDVTGLPIA